ncbi:prepilin peptidase [Candidatus Parcubacteria bacterium]|nr:prepilin peptidase [Candidatus Parcubacteria bacterium]
MFIYFFIFGTIIGSFLNVIIFRLRAKKQFLKGRSCCPKCKKKIIWYDNIPIVSFLILRGRCRNCKTKISFQYPLVELSTGILFVIIFFHNYQLLFNLLTTDYRLLITIFRDLFFVSVLIIIFVYDLKYYLILDKITFPAIIIASIFNLLLGFSLANILISAIIGGSFFLIQFLISKGRWIGGGDIRLGILMGVMLGWKMALLAIMIAYIIGAIISVILLTFKKKGLKSQIPLGTFLSAATIIVMLYGNEILEWYLETLTLH